MTNPQGSKVTAVEYYDEKKERHVQEASAVVLAAWAAQNPRIMLNSASDKHASGLANGSGLLGKYMMAHFASGTWALFDEDIQNYLGTTGVQFMSYDRYGKTSHKGAFGSTFITAGNALKTSDLAGFANARLDLFGPELTAFMKRAARGLTRLNAFGEALPNIENRIELVGDKDEFGMPLAKIVHSFDQDAVALWNANFEEGLKIAKATGAKEVWSGRGNMPTIHLMGGTIMGTEVRNSLTNSYGQTHELANLYVAGSGIFPIRRRGPLTRPTPFLRSPCAGPSTSPRIGAASRDRCGLACTHVRAARAGRVERSIFRYPLFRLDKFFYPGLMRGSSLSALSRSMAREVGLAEAPVRDALVDLGAVAEGVVGAVEHLRDRHQLEKRRDLPRGITLCELVVKLPELRTGPAGKCGPAFLGKANEAAGQERQRAPAMENIQRMSGYFVTVPLKTRCASCRGIGGVLNRARANARNETAAVGRRRWMDIDDGFAPVELVVHRSE